MYVDARSSVFRTGWELFSSSSSSSSSTFHLIALRCAGLPCTHLPILILILFSRFYYYYYRIYTSHHVLPVSHPPTQTCRKKLMYQCPVTTNINVNTTIKTFYPTLPTCIFLRAIDPLRRAVCMCLLLRSPPWLCTGIDWPAQMRYTQATPSHTVRRRKVPGDVMRCAMAIVVLPGSSHVTRGVVGSQSSASSVSHVRLPSVCGLRIRRSVSPTSSGYVASLVALLRCDGSGACRVLTRGQRSFDCA
jgi:hypothetical protein